MLILRGLTLPGLGFLGGAFLLVSGAFLPSHLLFQSGCGPVTDCLLAQAQRTPEKALAQVFPGAVVDRIPLYLTAAERTALEKELGFAVEGRFHTFYRARREGRLEGVGIFDTHRVRTKEETLFIVVDPQGFVQHVEVISFFEPDEYAPPERWLKLMLGRKHGDTLRPGSEIPAITGSTLTTTAVSRAVRRVLALEKLLRAHGGIARSSASGVQS
ncbi:MAG: hypothetical protein HY042_01400 [Spirochaetia bacterium]|nr:hypothetical protein [Spirochaetia bacterium]